MTFTDFKGSQLRLDPSALDTAETRTLAELAGLLRVLRRRHARQRRDSELTYREIATRTGWSHTAIAEYFTGKTLPPIDRFDALVGLLGATPAEQGALATARDRVAEHHRRTPRTTGRRGRKPTRADPLTRLEALLARRRVPAVTVGSVSPDRHWAYRVADQFPDGLLYVNVRGLDADGAAMSTGDAIRHFFASLDVPRQRIPPKLDAKAALYRSDVAGHRMLILLDNPDDATADQPVLLTNRGLPGVAPIAFDVLTTDEGRELLVGCLGSGRVRAEPDAVAEVIASHARVPLALAVAVTARDPRLPLHIVAEQLCQDTFCVPDASAVFSTAYQVLSPPAARLFRLLGVVPGPDIAAPAAAGLAAVPESEVAAQLAELTRASLLAEPVPGRFTCHDLVHAYARNLAETVESEEWRRAATRRVLDHYLHTAHAADRLLDPVAEPLPLTPPDHAVTPQRFAARHQALDWFTAEHPVLLSAVAHAAATGWHTHCGQLAWVMWTFLDRMGHWHDQEAIGGAAVIAATSLGDPMAQARAHRVLAHAHTRLGRFADADTGLKHALDLYDRAEDLAGQAHTHFALGHLAGQQDRPGVALQHAQRARTLYRVAGDRTGEAHALNQIGWCQAVLGNHRQAFTYCRQALARHQELGDRVGQVHSLDSLGSAHQGLGNHSQALTCYQHALDLHRELGNHYYLAVTLTRVGDIHHEAGDRRAAETAWHRALTIFDDLEYASTDQLRARLALLTD